MQPLQPTRPSPPKIASSGPVFPVIFFLPPRQVWQQTRGVLFLTTALIKLSWASQTHAFFFIPPLKALVFEIPFFEFVVPDIFDLLPSSPKRGLIDAFLMIPFADPRSHQADLAKLLLPAFFSRFCLTESSAIKLNLLGFLLMFHSVW